MERLRLLVWWLAGAFPLFVHVARSLAPNPFHFVVGKPLERWLLLYDLGARHLALGNDPRTVETIMLDRKGSFPKSETLERLLRPLIGRGVFGQPGGPAVRESRRLFIRALARISDDELLDTCRQVTESYVRRWLLDSVRKPVPICTELSRLTVDIVSRCTLRACFDTHESERFTRLFFKYHRQCAPLLLLLSDAQPETQERLVHGMGIETIGTEMRRLVRRRFLTPLIEGHDAARTAPFAASLQEAGLLATSRSTANSGTDGNRALDEIAVMLLAGHETAASVMSWLIWELACRPEDQAVAAALFLDEAPTGSDDPSPADCSHRWRGINAETLTKGLIREALRLYPPIAFFLRETTEEVNFRDKSIPRGSFLVVSPWTLQRHRKKWDRPHDFVPERWWKQQHEPARTSFMPFGMGPRTCPGAHFAMIEMSEILRTLLSLCCFSTPKQQDPKPLGSLTSRPSREIYLTVAPRRGVHAR